MHPHRQTIGTNDIKTASRTDGSNPVMTPKITFGTFSMNERNPTSVVAEMSAEFTAGTGLGLLTFD
jgi:hypothetical protein